MVTLKVINTFLLMCISKTSYAKVVSAPDLFFNLTEIPLHVG